MIKNTTIGRPNLPIDEKSVKLSISIPPGIFALLKGLSNRSDFIVQAIIEKIKREK